MQEDTITHNFPVWRDKANFIIAVKLTESDVPSNWKWEQIWAKQLEENTFEVCCIPFFVYGLSLGDIVDTHTLDGKNYVVKSLIKASLNQVFRVWLSELSNREAIISDLTALHCLIEIRGENSKLISIASTNNSSTTSLRDYLSDSEKKGLLDYEDGNLKRDEIIG